MIVRQFIPLVDLMTRTAYFNVPVWSHEPWQEYEHYELSFAEGGDGRIGVEVNSHDESGIENVTFLKPPDDCIGVAIHAVPEPGPSVGTSVENGYFLDYTFHYGPHDDYHTGTAYNDDKTIWYYE